jgi:FAD/FMN-containing dehydrogenase
MVPEPVDPGLPGTPVLVHPLHCLAELSGAEPALAGSPDLRAGDEIDLLEDPDVLLHAVQGETERLGQLAYRGRPPPEPLDDAAASAIGQREERAVEGSVILHRSVHYSDHELAQVSALGGALAGEVLVPGAPGYESARRPAMARFHETRPLAIVRCASPGDVAATLAFARRSDLHVAVRSGGHCFAGRSSTAGIVIDVTPINAVSVADGVATVGAGTRLADLYDALDQHGLTLPAGCGPTVGIVGLTLGGGVGILGRKYGLTCDRLLAAQVVLADGRVVDCDEHHDADLFWGLCGGGGGQLGVVTSLAFKPVPATAATTFHLVWPHSAAVAVIDAWQHWAPDAPDELNASLKLAAAGDPSNPPVVHLFGAMLGHEPETDELLEQMVGRVGIEPESASHRHQRFRAAKQALVGVGAAEDVDPDRPVLTFSKTEFFRRPLPTDAIGALVDLLASGRVHGESRELNFTPWGGAYNRVPPDATAFAHRDERFLLEHVLTAERRTRSVEREWVNRSWATVHPWGSGRVYPNFPDPELPNWAEAYHAGNYDRLLRTKHTYDPDNLLRFPQQSLAGPKQGRSIKS